MTSSKKWHPILSESILLRINPVYWILLVVILVIIIIPLIHFSHFSFSNANFFTFVWTYLLLLAIHTLLNLKHFNVFIATGHSDEIYKSFMDLTLIYLPYLIIAVIYENLILFTDFYGSSLNTIDISLMNIDQFIFGGQPTIWLESYLNPVAVEILMIGYGLFFIYPFGYLIYLVQKNQINIFQEVLFAQVLILILSLFCFVAFPAVGPRFTLEINPVMPSLDLPFYMGGIEGVEIPFLYQLTGYKSFYAAQVDIWNYLERIKTDCMPSMHTGLCLLCLFYALKYRDIFKRKQLAQWSWIIGVIILIISTVYLRYHWVIDVIAGVLSAIVVYGISRVIFYYWYKTRKAGGLSDFEANWLRKSAEFQKNYPKESRE